MTRVQVGNRTYDIQDHRYCKVFRHPDRAEIERAVLQSYSYASVIKAYVEDGPPEARFTEETLRRHVHAGHMPIKETARRVMVEERAKELGRNINDYHAALADEVVYLRQALQQAYEHLPNQVPTVRDGVAIARALAEVEALAESPMNQEAILKGFMVYMQATEAVIGEFAPGKSRDAMEAIGRRLRADPVMRELLGRTERPIDAVAEPQDEAGQDRGGGGSVGPGVLQRPRRPM